MHKTTVLTILDGWGICDKNCAGNPIKPTNAPNYFSFLEKYPFAELSASGESAGLFKGQEGNSEAGHFNLGAGRIVKQDALYISEAIEDGSFFKNSALMQAAKHADKHKSSVHIFGLLSNHNSAHSCPEHLYSVLEFFRKENIKNVFLHLFTDGRDSGQHDATKHLKKLVEKIKNGEKVATIMGRFYGMDRNKAWSRTKRAYEAMVLGKGCSAPSADEALSQAYNREETDEFICPTVITDGKHPVATIKDNDALVFFNLRSDRARQLAKVFAQKDFEKVNPGAFHREKMVKNLCFVALTDFGPDLLGIFTAFPSRDVKDSLVQILCPKKQMYVAESEKFAHITYFFNGGYARHFCDEEWIKIPSPEVDNYAKKPEMSSEQIADKVIEGINSNKYDFIACNFASPDMVGHSGDYSAAVKAVAFVDKQIKRIEKAVLENNAQCIITSDHGNIETMINPKTQEIDTQHSTNLVPCILIGTNAQKIRAKGKLADVAPTVLKMMEIKQPKEMTGKSLI